MTSKKEMSAGRKPLDEEYLDEQGRGTLQNRAMAYQEKLSANNGQPLVAAAAVPGRFMVQLAKRLIREEIPLISDTYVHNKKTNKGVLPVFGRASAIGAQTVISPDRAQAVKLT